MMAVKKAAPARTAYTKEKRQADTMEMLHAINLHAEQEAHRRAAAAIEEEYEVDISAVERKYHRMSCVLLGAGTAILIAAYGAMMWQGQQLLAAYRG